MPATIVVGVDDSPGALDALALAAALQPALEAEIVVTHVETHLRRSGERGGSASTDGVHRPVRRVTVRAMSVVRGLRSVAEAEGAVLVIAGISHRIGFGRRSRDAGGELLLHSTGCAVGLVPPGWARTGDRDVRVIGVGFDGGRESTEATVAAAALAQLLGATVRIYAFTSPVPVGEGLPPADRTITGMTAKERLEQQLEAVLEALPPAVRPFGQVLVGMPVRDLVDRSAEVDLMVLGSHGRGAFERALLGSVATMTPSATHAPVLVFPPGSANPFTQALLAEA